MEVEVVYALPQEQYLEKVSVARTATVRDAIQQSGVLEKFPDIDLINQNKIGIFGKACTMDTAIQAGNRIEIYRPLIADPKQVRKKRAEKQKKQ